MTTKRLQRQHQLYLFLLVAFAVSIPVSINLSSYVTVLLALNWLLEGDYQSKLKRLLHNKFSLATLFIFMLFALGLLYTSNMREGLRDVEHKASLFVVPLILFTSRLPGPAMVQKVLISFVAACLVVSSIALALAGARYLHDGDASHLFYHQLSSTVGMHAIYLSCYLVFSFFILLYLSFHHRHKLRPAYLTGILILELYIIALLLLLSSKTLLAVLLVLLTLYLILYFGRHKSKTQGLWVAAAFNTLLIALIVAIPYTRERFEDAIFSNLSVLQQDSFKYNTEFTGLSLRLVLWKFAYLVNKQENSELFGVGTGDSNDELLKVYKSYNLYLGDPSIPGDIGYGSYNTHNQFVETYLKLGLFGFIYLAAFFVALLRSAIRTRHLLLLTWLIIFISFSFTESTLQVNKGIIYFAFFIPFLLQARFAQSHT